MNNTKITDKLNQDKGILTRFTIGMTNQVTLIISQTKSQNKEKIQLKKESKTHVKRLRGDDLRDLYFEVKRYLSIIEEEKNQKKGTRLENEFKLENQVQDLGVLLEEIKKGWVIRSRGKWNRPGGPGQAEGQYWERRSDQGE